MGGQRYVCHIVYNMYLMQNQPRCLTNYSWVFDVSFSYDYDITSTVSRENADVASSHLHPN